MQAEYIYPKKTHLNIIQHHDTTASRNRPSMCQSCLAAQIEASGEASSMRVLCMQYAEGTLHTSSTKCSMLPS